MRLEKKELLLLIPGTLLAIGGVGPDDLWVVGPCLAGAWLSFLFMCFIHSGPPKIRLVVATVITVTLLFVGYRRFHSVYKNPDSDELGRVARPLN
jgi:membrane protein implicated in regulation of membrane protease activity